MEIRFKEEMAGTYKPLVPGLPGGEFRFQVQVKCVDPKDFRVIDGTLTGKVFMDGVADGAPLDGTIVISPHWKRIIAYRFTFPVAGKTYSFDGTKNINLFRTLHTMTTLPGTIFDETGREIGKANTTFNVKRDILPFLLSYRFSLPSFRV